MSKRILIFGSNGMLGTYVKNVLDNKHTVIPLERKDYNIELDNYTKLKELVSQKKVDIIVNCAGKIPQRGELITEKRSFFIINSIFPIYLSNICFEMNIKFIHITTDCVFTGKEGNYNEKSYHDENNNYGLSKSLGEKFDYGTIIRTSIIGEEKLNKKSLLEWVKSNKNGEINGYNNYIWNGVTCLELSYQIENIIKNNTYYNGIKHLFSPNKVSKYELLQIINNVFQLNIIINKNNLQSKIDKSLSSNFDFFDNVEPLEIQIKKLKNFSL